MKYKELRKKWDTGERFSRKAKANILGAKGEVEMDYEVHCAPVGDFLNEYIKHLKIPWWRRHWSWDLVEKDMRKSLNQIQLEFTYWKRE